ncbi:MAG: hypothetical protein M3Q03_16185 [Chloroflexota bacterium]|nr:hypothetical protein [Chloroflexota bacterium]
MGKMQGRNIGLHRTFVALIAVLLLTLIGVDGARVAAQDTFDLPISKIDCTVEPSDKAVRDFALFGTEAIPVPCTIAVGVTFTAATAAGTSLGSCQLGVDGSCTISVPVPSTVVVTEDVSTAALGFAPRENPITVEVEPATEASAIFVNLSQPDLPETGAGTAASARHTGFAALLLGGLSFAFGGRVPLAMARLREFSSPPWMVPDRGCMAAGGHRLGMAADDGIGERATFGSQRKPYQSMSPSESRPMLSRCF